MIVLLFGAPGTGKSTYANYLSKKLGIEWINTGQIFRDRAKSDPKLADLLKSGQLVPDDEVDQVLFAKLKNTKPGFILDGYPRTLNQAQTFSQFLKDEGLMIDRVFHLQVPVETVVKRILKRGRSDDSEETVKRRFEIYESETHPAIKFFENSGAPVFEIDNSKTISEVEKEFDESFKNS